MPYDAPPALYRARCRRRSRIRGGARLRRARVRRSRMALVPTLGIDLIPQLAQGRFDMTVKLPPGTPLRRNRQARRRICSSDTPRIPASRRSTASAAPARASMRIRPNRGENIARLLDRAEADGGSKKVEARRDRALRAAWPIAAGYRSRSSRGRSCSAFSRRSKSRLRGYDLDCAGEGRQAARRADERIAALRRHEVDGRRAAIPEIQIHFDQDRAAALGLTTRADRRPGRATRCAAKSRRATASAIARSTCWCARSRSERGSVDDIRNLIVGYCAGRCDVRQPTDGSSSTAPRHRLASNGSSRQRFEHDVRARSPTRRAAATTRRCACRPSPTSSRPKARARSIASARSASRSSRRTCATAISAAPSPRSATSFANNPLAAGVKVHIGGQSEELDAR